MKRHSLAVTALLSATLGLLVFSCSDAERDSSSDAPAGAGGEVTSGGSAGSGGNAAHAGSGDPAGAGGASAPLGGTAGVAGSNVGGEHEAGTGGVPPGAGAAGDAGSAGASGAANTFGTCQVGCATHADCLSEDGAAEPRFCDADSLHCVECTEDAHCVPLASFWTRVVCTQDDDCATLFGEVCVDVAGIGRCAPTADPQLGCFDDQTPTSMTRFGSVPAATVEVCASDAGRCVAQRCIVGCTSVPDFCTAVLNTGHGEACDSASGRCTCSTNDECEGGPKHCNLLTHQCDECETAADCEGGEKGQACVDGRCGCSDVDQCPTLAFPAGTPICQ